MNEKAKKRMISNGLSELFERAQWGINDYYKLIEVIAQEFSGAAVVVGSDYEGMIEEEGAKPEYVQTVDLCDSLWKAKLQLDEIAENLKSKSNPQK